jgi:hypothetical protein
MLNDIMMNKCWGGVPDPFRSTHSNLTIATPIGRRQFNLLNYLTKMADMKSPVKQNGMIAK